MVPQGLKCAPWKSCAPQKPNLRSVKATLSAQKSWAETRAAVPNTLDYVPVLFLHAFMQSTFHFAQTADLRSVQDRLSAKFGRVPDGERLDPVSQFVCSLLGSRTHDEISWDAFIRLVGHYQTWDAIADALEADIKAVIWDVTYPERKVPELKQALRKIRACYGRISFDFLIGLDIEQALFQLEQIQGVGRKIAAATLNFSTFHGRAFVVDTHVLRVLRRFGFVGVNASAETAYDAVMAAADDFNADGLRELHWHLKSLGQQTCSHARAQCVSCPLSDICLRRVERGASMVTRTPAFVE